jgi:putative ABC transport system permease protein
VNPFALVARNLLRRRLRTLITLAGVAIAVAALFSLLSFQRGYQAGLRAELDRLGAHLLVVPKGCPYDAASIALHGASWPCYLEEKYLATVRATPHVAVAAPVFMSAVYDANTGAQTVYCGVAPDILRVKRAWRIVEGAFPDAPSDLLVGSEIAARNRWRVGQTVPLPGLSPARTGRICGVLAPTQGADDEFVYLRLRDAQTWFGRPAQLTHLLVRLDDPQAMDAAVQALRGCDAGLEMNIVPLAHLFRTIQGLVQSTRLLLCSVAFVALLAAGAGVSNTILIAVADRTREIGVLRALGASRPTIFALLWAETLALCVLGGMGGVLIGVLFSRGVETWLRARLPFAPTGPLVQPEVVVALLCVGGSALLGTLAGLLPAWRAARLSPVEAIRRTAGA